MVVFRYLGLFLGLKWSQRLCASCFESGCGCGCHAPFTGCDRPLLANFAYLLQRKDISLAVNNCSSILSIRRGTSLPLFDLRGYLWQMQSSHNLRRYTAVVHHSSASVYCLGMVSLFTLSGSINLPTSSNWDSAQKMDSKNA